MRGLDKRTREIVIAQYNNQCAECDKVKGLDIHHIIPRRRGGTDSLHNLILLCGRHHRLEDSNPFRYEKRKVSFKIDRNIWHKCKVFAAEKDTTITAILEHLLEDHLDHCKHEEFRE